MATWESNNSYLCEVWTLLVLTTADNFRRCDRSGCGAVERNINGVWTSVAEKQEKKKKTGKNTKFVPGSLF